MSVTFRSSKREINLSNINAADVMRAIGLAICTKDGLCGEINSSQLAVICSRALIRDANRTDITTDPGIESSEEIGANGAKLINCGRQPGYIPMRIRELRQLAIDSPGEIIYWD